MFPAFLKDAMSTDPSARLELQGFASAIGARRYTTKSNQENNNCISGEHDEGPMHSL